MAVRVRVRVRVRPLLASCRRPWRSHARCNLSHSLSPLPLIPPPPRPTQSNPLEQLPGLNADEIKALQAASKTKDSALRDFLALPQAEQKALLLAQDRLKKPESKKVVDELLLSASLLPNVQVTLDHYVEEEGEDEYGLLDEDVKVSPPFSPLPALY